MLKRFLYLFVNAIFFIVSLMAAEETEKTLPLSDINGGSPTLVNNCVNVITGDYLESSFVWKTNLKLTSNTLYNGSYYEIY